MWYFSQESQGIPFSTFKAIEAFSTAAAVAYAVASPPHHDSHVGGEENHLIFVKVNSDCKHE